MGPGRPISSAVTDSGPLIHLAEIGSLALLRVFDRLHVPQAVWHEIVTPGRLAEADVRSLHIVQLHAVPPADLSVFVDARGLQALHEGERECLFLCTQIGASILLTDDLAVRDAAWRLGFTPVGSLGIIVRAYRLGRIALADAEHCMQDLYAISSLFVTRAIVDIAIAQLRSGSGHS